MDKHSFAAADQGEVSVRHYLPLMTKERVESALFGTLISTREAPLGLTELKDRIADFSLEPPITFPSHFFEYENKDACLEILQASSTPFFVQVSPGAELKDYASEILSIGANKKNSFGIELVMNRSPHEQDWKALEEIEKTGINIKYIFCPVLGVDSVAAISSLPPKILSELFFYFPTKKNKRDIFLNQDAILVLISNLESALPKFKCRPIKYVSKAEQRTAGESETQKSAGLVRSAMIRMARNALTAPLLLFPYIIMWLIHNPLSALGVLWIKISHILTKTYWIFLRGGNALLLFFIKASYKCGHVAFLIKQFVKYKIIFRSINICKMALSFIYYRIVYGVYYKIICGIYYGAASTIRAIRYQILYPAYFKVLLKLYYLFYHLIHLTLAILRNPVFATKEHFPFVYFIFLFPFLKTYWFIKFQVNKRILGLLENK